MHTIFMAIFSCDVGNQFKPNDRKTLHFCLAISITPGVVREDAVPSIFPFEAKKSKKATG